MRRIHATQLTLEFKVGSEPLHGDGKYDFEQGIIWDEFVFEKNECDTPTGNRNPVSGPSVDLFAFNLNWIDFPVHPHKTSLRYLKTLQPPK